MERFHHSTDWNKENQLILNEDNLEKERQIFSFPLVNLFPCILNPINKLFYSYRHQCLVSQREKRSRVVITLFKRLSLILAKA